MIPAVVLSVLVGARAATIHSVPYSSRRDFWRWFWNGFQEFLQNFVGSFAGWCCVGALAVRISAAPDLRSLSGVDVFLFLAAILGVSGRLAETVHRFIDAIGKIVEGVVKKVG